jgi:DNA-binding response OmpR family regulator
MYRIVVSTVPARQAYFLRAFVERGYRWAFGADEPTVADEVLRSSTDLLVVDAVALSDLAGSVVSSVKRISGLAMLPVLAVVPEAAASETLATRFWDEFVLDPFRPGELILRIEMMLARRRGSLTREVNFGPVTIDFEKYDVTRSGRRVSLTYKEHELLRFLASNPDRPFTREALLDRVWGADYIGGVRTVDVHVRRLRAKLGDVAGKTIETVRGVGYRFRKTRT